jgi:hypothetical protein
MFLREVRMNLKEVVVVGHTVDDGFDVVRLVSLNRDDTVQYRVARSTGSWVLRTGGDSRLLEGKNDSSSRIKLRHSRSVFAAK